MMNYADYDLNSIICHYECSIKWFNEHKEDIGIKDKTIKRHVATLNYLKELKELKEKIDNPTTQVIVADANSVDQSTWCKSRPYYRGFPDLDVASMHPFDPKPAYTNRCGCKSQDHKIKKVEFNGPATIIFWEDNTKTVVKNTVPSEYDREKAILYAVVKKLATKKEYNDILRTIDKGRTNYEWI